MTISGTSPTVQHHLERYALCIVNNSQGKHRNGPHGSLCILFENSRIDIEYTSTLLAATESIGQAKVASIQRRRSAPDRLQHDC